MPGGIAIPSRTLILSEPLGAELAAERAAGAIAAGLIEGGAPELLDELGFDARMRAARALLLAVASLEESTLAGSLAFEAATRARQSGVPCYAVGARNRLGPFDLRILDLQVVIEAATTPALRSAGRRLAEVI
jgi:glycerate kinase